MPKVCSAAVTSKGQLVIPAELRRRYRIKPGTRVYFEPAEAGIFLRTVNIEDIHALEGSLKHLPYEEPDCNSLDGCPA